MADAPPARSERAASRAGAPGQPQTRRAARSLAGQIAPVAVLVVGFLYVVLALTRLDGIYEDDPGILSAAQIVPPLAGHGFVNYLPAPTGAGFERIEALETSALALFANDPSGEEAADVTVAQWQDRPDGGVVVVVATFSGAPGATRGLALATDRRQRTAGGSPVAQAAWLSGERMVIGVLAGASEQAAADALLDRSRDEIAASVEIARVFWYELVALGPLLVLFVLWVSLRLLLFLAFFAAVAAVALVAASFLLVFVVLLLVVAAVVLAGRALWKRLGGDKEGTAFDANAVAPVEAAAPPAGGPAPTLEVEAPLALFDISAEKGERQAFLAVVVVIGFGVAALTPSLFPSSVIWGSMAVAALCVSPGWSRRFRHLAKVRKALLWLTGALILSVFLGLAPYLLSDHRLAIVLVPLGLVALVGQWRHLTEGTEVGYSEWHEDVDVRSTLFMLGAATLTVGAGSLFLASSGRTDVTAHVQDKALGAVGLIVALTASANVRAARDAARRDRARERGTPTVLYLRSFDDDNLKVVSPRLQRAGLERLSWRRRELFEDVIARSLSRIGPVVAIARPGTGQRDLGPARDSIISEDWLGAVKAYMGQAALVAVVIGSSEGLVLELETLGQLGLLDRLCVFVPPVDDEEVARRLAVLGRQPGYSNTWGVLQEDEKHKIVALSSIHHGPFVMTARRRTAIAYRNCAKELPALTRGGAAAPLAAP